MSVSLKKNEGISLKKESPNLSKLEFGLGWDPAAEPGVKFDLDASIIATGDDHKVLDDGWFVYYKNTKSPDGSIQHSGDDRTGGNSEDGDDEVISIDLTALNERVHHLHFIVSIDEAESRKQDFGKVNRAYIRVVDVANGGNELTKYDLSNDAKGDTALVAASLSRDGGNWRFEAKGETYASGLIGIVTDFGMSVSD